MPGPMPKADGRRARRNKQPEKQIFYVEPAWQPNLPNVRPWPVVTLEWWKAWRKNPLSASFTESDWSFLMDTALVHAAVWGDGELRYMAELRQRVAKFGVTPEDRARLRIQFAEADAKAPQVDEDAPDEDTVAQPAGSAQGSRSRYAKKHLRAVDDPA